MHAEPEVSGTHQWRLAFMLVRGSGNHRSGHSEAETFSWTVAMTVVGSSTSAGGTTASARERDQRILAPLFTYPSRLEYLHQRRGLLDRPVVALTQTAPS